MKIIILVKQVADVALNIRVKDGAIQEDGLQYIMSAHDECAVEEALQIKDKVGGGELTVLSMGPDRFQETIRKALALGADKAIHISDAAVEGGDATANAKIFAKVLKDLQWDIILTGKQAQDTDMQATAEVLGEMLNIPMVSNTKKLEILDGGKKLVAYRQADGCVEVVEVEAPCLISVNNDINNPRNASLKGIMAAKKKPIDKKDLAAIGLGAGDVGKNGSLIERIKFDIPPAKKAGKKFEGDPEEIGKEVVKLLQEEAKVL